MRGIVKSLHLLTKPAMCVPNECATI